jgi:hypothetical protein
VPGGLSALTGHRRAATPALFSNPSSSPLLSSHDLIPTARLHGEQMGLERTSGHSTKETIPATSTQLYNHPRLFPLYIASTVLVIAQKKKYYWIRRVQQP